MSNYRSMASHTPRPTEYAGVRFRSKSEAVFARCLDLAGHVWEYEPGSIAGHQWDFLIDRKNNCGKHRERFVFLEYKPSEPTMAYVNSLIDNMRHCPVESLLVWGNPWSPGGFPNKNDCYVTYPLFSHDSKFGWGRFNPMAEYGEDRPFSIGHETSRTLFLNSHASDAASYRFDLRSTVNQDGVKYSDFHDHVDLDLDPLILINFTNTSEHHRRARLKLVAAEAVKSIGLFKIHELYDHKGELTVVWRNRPIPMYLLIMNYIWNTVGLESTDSVRHIDLYGDSVPQ
jgi:hypothetical protein